MTSCTRTLALTTQRAYWVDVVGIRGAKSATLVQWFPGSTRLELGLVPAALQALAHLGPSAMPDLSHFVLGLQPKGHDAPGDSAQLMLLASVLWSAHATHAGQAAVRVGEEPTGPMVVVTGSGALAHVAGDGDEISVESVQHWPSKAEALRSVLEQNAVSRVHVLVPHAQLDTARRALLRAMGASSTSSPLILDAHGVPVHLQPVACVWDVVRVVPTWSASPPATDLDKLQRALHGRYSAITEVGSGAFATVYRAVNLRDQRLVAIKVLHSRWATTPVTSDLFERGARQMAGLRHPGVARVFEPCGRAGSMRYVTLEYLPGGTLMQRIMSGEAPSTARVLQVIFRVAEALSAAHEIGLIHGDVKPQNVLFRADDQPVLVDFEVAKLDREGITGTLGTLLYAAPEAHQQPTVLSDVYSLAATTAVALYGGAPDPLQFVRSPDAFVAQIPCNNAIKHVLRSGLQADPSLRPSSVSALAQQLAAAHERAGGPRFQAGAAPGRRAVWIGAAVVAAVVLTAFAIAVALRSPIGTPATDDDALADRLSAAAWRQADDRPGEALALLRAAAEVSERERDDAVLSRLSWSGGEARVLAHDSAVVSLAASPDGRWLFTGTTDGVVTTWDVQTGAQVARVPSARGPISALLATTDLQVLAWGRSGEDSNVLRRVDPRTDQVTGSIPLPGPILSAISDPSGRWLLSLGRWGGATVHDLANSKRTQRIDLPGGEVYWGGGAIDQQGRGVAVGSPDHRWAFDPTSVRALPPAGRPEQYTSSAVSADLNSSYFGTSDRLIRVDNETGEVVAEVRAVASDILTLSSDGTRAVTGGLRVWTELRDARSLHVVARLDGHLSRQLPPIFSPDSRWVVSGGFDGSLQVWSAATGTLERSLRGHQAGITSLVFLDHPTLGLTLASASRDGDVRLWHGLDPSRRLVHRVLAEEWGRPLGLGRSPGKVLFGLEDAPPVWVDAASAQILDGDSPLTVDGTAGVDVTDGTGRRAWIRNWQVRYAIGDESYKPADLNAAGPIRQALWRPGTDQLIVSSVQGPTYVYDTSSGSTVLQLDGPPPGASEISLSADARLLAVSSFAEHTPTWIWDLEKQTKTSELSGHSSPVSSVAWSPSGASVVTGSWDRTARVWDVATGSTTHTLKGHKGDVSAVAWSADGVIATGSKDGVVRLWSAQTGRLQQTLRGHRSGVVQLAFSADAAWLTSASGDGEVRVWTMLAEDDPGADVRNNLRVCRGQVRAVPVVPYPGDTVWAPPADCAPDGESSAGPPDR